MAMRNKLECQGTDAVMVWIVLVFFCGGGGRCVMRWVHLVRLWVVGGGMKVLRCEEVVVAMGGYMKLCLKRSLFRRI